ncbi:hypothetical protein M3Y96_00780600 [Aphelenchoides besseyi]|nr:hypothetical protein M3Y96_00780600 [Aphelenchoides besseyi]
MIEDFGLPWAKGSLQPRNGKRSSNGWNLGQRNIPPGNSFNSTALTDVLKPYNNNSPQFDNSFTTYTKKPSNIYQTVSEEAYSYAPRPIDYPINPRSSFNSFAVDLPSTYVNPNLHGNTPEEHRRFEKEQHRIDLLRQIEDNQRREQMRKHEEWQEEERERWRSELTLRRQRAEVEREQDEVRQRQLAAEFKAQQAAFEVPCEKENTKRNVSKRQRSQEAVAPSRRDSIDSKPRLEWWEKKSAWGDKRISSPVIPTHRERRQSNPSRASRVSGRESVRSDLISASRSGVPAKFNRSGSPPSRQSRSHSRSSRRGYQPSIASRAGSDSSALRRLSITRRNLELEREVLRSAVDKNKYDDHVFESKGRR